MLQYCSLNVLSSSTRKERQSGPQQRNSALARGKTRLIHIITHCLLAASIFGWLGSSPLHAQIVWSGPIVITAGGTYSGNWRSLNPNTPAVDIQTTSPVTIRGSRIASKGTLIQSVVAGANVTILNVTGFALNPDVAGTGPGRFVDAEQVSKLVVGQNYLEGTAGIYVQQPLAGAYINIYRNSVRNINGRHSTGTGDGYVLTDAGGYDVVQFVQFNGVTGASYTNIGYNQVIDDPSIARTEDVINMYQSSGSATAPISIHDNYIRGSYPGKPNADQFSGGGIIADQGSSYMNVYHNQVIETVNYGLGNASSGGHNNYYGNTVLGIGILPDGIRAPAQNVGIYDTGGGPNDTIHDNVIGWYDASGNRNDLYIPSCPATTCSYNNVSLPSPITKTQEDNEWTKWQTKLTSAGFTVGSTNHP